MVKTFIKQCHEHLARCERMGGWQGHSETVYAVHGPEEKQSSQRLLKNKPCYCSFSDYCTSLTTVCVLL